MTTAACEWNQAEAWRIVRGIVSHVSRAGKESAEDLLIWEGICGRIDRACEARSMEALEEAAADFLRAERRRPLPRRQH